MKAFGGIIKLITFPGTFLHMFWEQLMCNLYEIQADNTQAVKLGELSGHVRHDFIKSRGEQFYVCFLPFLANLFLSFILGSISAVKIFVLGEEEIIFYVMLWVGVSLSANLFPLIQDAAELWRKIYGEENGVALRIIAFPICTVLYAGAYLNTWGLTLFTTIAFLALCLL